MKDEIHLQYWSAQLYPRLFPIIMMGDHADVIEVYKYLKPLPSDDRIVALLNQLCIDRLARYGIDHHYIL